MIEIPSKDKFEVQYTILFLLKFNRKGSHSLTEIIEHIQYDELESSSRLVLCIQICPQCPILPSLSKTKEASLNKDQF